MPDDGFMDGVHARRDQLGADLVSLIVDNDTGSCGVAWLMQTPSVTFAPQAFSVTVYDCISPNYTFGHELGHNMGAAHAPDDPNLPAGLSVRLRLQGSRVAVPHGDGLQLPHHQLPAHPVLLEPRRVLRRPSDRNRPSSTTTRSR